ncbi:MAG TPA: 2-C-methyl-D-erythritol 4-phosphate cytidylyltransferase [Candidatus Binatia bacterium]|nr:2-C-methyl-D-erythritol 4-phosphate cytidylyltransferase [Candidatus Binatia bacterium]
MRSLARPLGVIIAAGGLGTRLGGRVPKQFRSLGSEPVLAATVRHFVAHPGVQAVVVAAPAEHVERARRILGRLCDRVRAGVVAGGPTRQASVAAALAALPADVPLVVVHDAVRPFISRPLIDRVVAAARATGAAVCALPVVETVKRVREGRVEATLDRSELWAVQTPQAFRAELLREAHDKARRDGVLGTDDAMLVERLGHPVRVVPGSPDNVKITTAADLARARRRLRA